MKTTPWSNNCTEFELLLLRRHGLGCFYQHTHLITSLTSGNVAHLWTERGQGAFLLHSQKPFILWRLPEPLLLHLSLWAPSMCSWYVTATSTCVSLPKMMVECLNGNNYTSPYLYIWNVWASSWDSLPPASFLFFVLALLQVLWDQEINSHFSKIFE